MNKSQLVEAVALDANISKVDARKAVDAIIRVTVHSLRQGERLTLTGLGTAETRTYGPQSAHGRPGEDPAAQGHQVPPHGRGRVISTAFFNFFHTCQKSHNAPS